MHHSQATSSCVASPSHPMSAAAAAAPPRPVNELALRKNLQLVNFVCVLNPIPPRPPRSNTLVRKIRRSCATLFAGAAAGILGLKGWSGFTFFAVTWLAVSGLLYLKTGNPAQKGIELNADQPQKGSDVKAYFRSPMALVDGMVNGVLVRFGCSNAARCAHWCFCAALLGTSPLSSSGRTFPLVCSR